MQRGLCVCVLGTEMGCAKTGKQIEMSLERLTRVGPRNHMLDGSPDPPRKLVNFGRRKALGDFAAV